MTCPRTRTPVLERHRGWIKPRVVLLFANGCGVALFLAANDIRAQSVNGVVPVSTTVANNCSVSSTNAVNFGAYRFDVLCIGNSAGRTVVTCTKGTSAVIALDNGRNATSDGQRRMQSPPAGALAASFLEYALLRPTDAGPTAGCNFVSGVGEWTTGAGAFDIGPAPSSSARSIVVCARLPGGQSVRAGRYSDTVGVTVTF